MAAVRSSGGRPRVRLAVVLSAAALATGQTDCSKGGQTPCAWAIGGWESQVFYDPADHLPGGTYGSDVSVESPPGQCFSGARHSRHPFDKIVYPGPINILVHNWKSSALISAVAGILMREKLGYEVRLVQYPTEMNMNMAYTSLAELRKPSFRAPDGTSRTPTEAWGNGTEWQKDGRKLTHDFDFELWPRAPTGSGAKWVLTQPTYQKVGYLSETGGVAEVAPRTYVGRSGWYLPYNVTAQAADATNTDVDEWTRLQSLKRIGAFDVVRSGNASTVGTGTSTRRTRLMAVGDGLTSYPITDPDFQDIINNACSDDGTLCCSAADMIPYKGGTLDCVRAQWLPHNVEALCCTDAMLEAGECPEDLDPCFIFVTPRHDYDPGENEERILFSSLPMVIYFTGTQKAIDASIASGYPILLYRWEPDLFLYKPDELIRVDMVAELYCRRGRIYDEEQCNPGPCRPQSYAFHNPDNTTSVCDYYQNTLHKGAYTGAQRATPDAYDLASALWLSFDDMIEMMAWDRDLRESDPSLSGVVNDATFQTACRWLQDHQEQWNSGGLTPTMSNWAVPLSAIPDSGHISLFGDGLSIWWLFVIFAGLLVVLVLNIVLQQNILFNAKCGQFFDGITDSVENVKIIGCLVGMCVKFCSPSKDCCQQVVDDAASPARKGTATKLGGSATVLAAAGRVNMCDRVIACAEDDDDVEVCIARAPSDASAKAADLPAFTMEVRVRDGTAVRGRNFRSPRTTPATSKSATKGAAMNRRASNLFNRRHHQSKKDIAKAMDELSVVKTDTDVKGRSDTVLVSFEKGQTSASVYVPLLQPREYTLATEFTVEIVRDTTDSLALGDLDRTSVHIHNVNIFPLSYKMSNPNSMWQRVKLIFFFLIEMTKTDFILDMVWRYQVLQFIIAFGENFLYNYLFEKFIEECVQNGRMDWACLIAVILLLGTVSRYHAELHYFHGAFLVDSHLQMLLLNKWLTLSENDLVRLPDNTERFQVARSSHAAQIRVNLWVRTHLALFQLWSTLWSLTFIVFSFESNITSGSDSSLWVKTIIFVALPSLLVGMLLWVIVRFGAAWTLVANEEREEVKAVRQADMILNRREIVRTQGSVMRCGNVARDFYDAFWVYLIDGLFRTWYHNFFTRWVWSFLTAFIAIAVYALAPYLTDPIGGIALPTYSYLAILNSVRQFGGATTMLTMSLITIFQTGSEVENIAELLNLPSEELAKLRKLREKRKNEERQQSKSPQRLLNRLRSQLSVGSPGASPAGSPGAGSVVISPESSIGSAVQAENVEVVVGAPSSTAKSAWARSYNTVVVEELKRAPVNRPPGARPETAVRESQSKGSLHGCVAVWDVTYHLDTEHKNVEFASKLIARRGPILDRMCIYDGRRGNQIYTLPEGQIIAVRTRPGLFYDDHPELVLLKLLSGTANPNEGSTCRVLGDRVMAFVSNHRPGLLIRGSVYDNLVFGAMHIPEPEVLWTLAKLGGLHPSLVGVAANYKETVEGWKHIHIDALPHIIAVRQQQLRICVVRACVQKPEVLMIHGVTDGCSEAEIKGMLALLRAFLASSQTNQIIDPSIVEKLVGTAIGSAKGLPVVAASGSASDDDDEWSSQRAVDHILEESLKNIRNMAQDSATGARDDISHSEAAIFAQGKRWNDQKRRSELDPYPRTILFSTNDNAALQLALRPDDLMLTLEHGRKGTQRAVLEPINDVDWAATSDSVRSASASLASQASPSASGRSRNHSLQSMAAAAGPSARSNGGGSKLLLAAAQAQAQATADAMASSTSATASVTSIESTSPNVRLGSSDVVRLELENDTPGPVVMATETPAVMATDGAASYEELSDGGIGIELSDGGIGVAPASERQDVAFEP